MPQVERSAAAILGSRRGAERGDADHGQPGSAGRHAGIPREAETQIHWGMRPKAVTHRKNVDSPQQGCRADNTPFRPEETRE